VQCDSYGEPVVCCLERIIKILRLNDRYPIDLFFGRWVDHRQVRLGGSPGTADVQLEFWYVITMT